MISIRTEVVGTVLVLATLVGIPLWLVREETRATEIPGGEDLHVITLTAVAGCGIWTFEEKYLEAEDKLIKRRPDSLSR